MKKEITLKFETSQDLECETIVIIPEKAIDEPGYIKAFTTKDSANAKHEYHAMAQMAYFQYQDDELEMTELGEPLIIKTSTEDFLLTDGMVLARTPVGNFLAFIQANQNKKKLLETGYRYCTRWVRLDL